jgi:RimJ/RimL family protein N-acetyltransferase
MVGLGFDMVRLEQHAFVAAGDIYHKQSAFFPLIAAVLRGDQNGEVFCDRADSPRAYYVEHSFGFAQVFGSIEDDFQTALRERLVLKKTFAASKVRLYTPEEPEFLRHATFDSIRSQRQRFVVDGTVPSFATMTSSFELRTLEVKDLPLLSPELVDVTRFWRTAGDFLSRARAIVAWSGRQSVAICYAAAIAADRAEIDVATATDFRRLGLGKSVVKAFVDGCRSTGVTPLWDCFTNNVGSMALARSCGFRPTGPAYSFYTISR